MYERSRFLVRRTTKNYLSLISILMIGWALLIDTEPIFAEDSTSESTTVLKSNEQNDIEFSLDDEVVKKYQDSGVQIDQYQKVWGDEFDVETLNHENWNVELHQPGWVNEEWQEYIDDEKVLKITDGNLVIQPVKETVDGQDLYFSGRVNTQNKHNFKYGFFEARVKVPKGQGYLPAFWLMSADESLYGQWPRCGEIDIMEVHGSDPTKSYGTIHYGNPHKESQGDYQLTTGDFSEEYHIFALEWLPGQIKWFVDGNLIHTENEWYSRTEGQGEVSYPAPFDSEFYVILNLAVGGSWVGYPNESTEFDGQNYSIDYVRVYQKAEYDENVAEPSKSFASRLADEHGNYIINPNFIEAESFEDEEGWRLLTTQGGSAKADISNQQLVISTEAAGDVDYSVQLVQADLPFEQNYQYRVSFKAWSDQKRIGRVAVTAPDNGYIRYLEDQTLDLNTEPKLYEFDFTMSQTSDENGRLEFNLGKVEQLSAFFLTDVKIERLNKVEVTTTKTILSDGNHVYNGQFQEGENRLEFWQWDSSDQTDAVSSLEDGRRLVINVSAENSEQVLTQKELPLEANLDYELSFDLEAKQPFNLKVNIGKQEFLIPINEGENHYQQTFSLKSDQLEDTDLKILFSNQEEAKLDNIKIQENRLIKNGSFNAGLTGYNAFIDGSANATVVIDSLSEDNAADFTIYRTGDQAWKIQLIQEHIPLIKGNKYQLSFKVKSNMDRKIMFALQRDGKADNNWITYFPEQIIPITETFQTIMYEFTMEEPDDLNSLLSISLGAVEAITIDEQHRIVIDDIILEQINKD